MFRAALACVVSALLMVTQLPCGAQQPVDIRDAGCGACGITVRRVVTLGGTNGPLVRRPYTILRTHDGRYLVSDGLNISGDSAIAVFRADGRFEHYLARRGEGPGELNAPMRMAAFGRDSLVVMEQLNIVLFNSQLKFAKTLTAARRMPQTGLIVAVLEGGTIVLQSSGPGADSLLFFTTSGSVSTVRSITLPRPPMMGLHMLATRPLPAKRDIWLIQSDSRGEVLHRLIDTTGRTEILLHRTLGWWYRPAPSAPVVSGAARADSLARPSSSFHGALEESGRLFVLYNHSSAEWRGVKRDDPRLPTLRRTFVEVIDIRTSRLLGRLDMPGQPLTLMRGGQFATYREDVDGIPYVDVWEIVIPG